MRISDWSSDVCSSDLARHRRHKRRLRPGLPRRDTFSAHDARSVRSWGSSECQRASRCPIGTSNHDTSMRSFALSRSEEHTSELQSLMRISYAVFCLKKKKKYETTVDKLFIRSRYENTTNND